MSQDLDPETFEEEKYTTYFSDLQQAYKAAFDVMNDRYDSTLVHAIDQQVLAESEPFLEESEARSASETASGEEPRVVRDFRLELPDDAAERVADAGVLVDDERLEEVLDRYADEITAQLRERFGLS